MPNPTDIDFRITLRNLLIEALKTSPGSSARELSHQFSGGDLSVTKTNINSVLYSSREQFWRIGTTPPRWYVATGASPTPSVSMRKSKALSIAPFDLYH